MLFRLADSGLLAYGPASGDHDQATGTDGGWRRGDADGGASEAWFTASFSGDGEQPEHAPLTLDAYPMAAQQLVASADYPWSTVVRVIADFPNGQTYVGSGVMVGRNDVLTTAHVVYHPDRGGLASTVIVTPAFIPERNYESPYGSSYATVGPVQALIAGTDIVHGGAMPVGNRGPGLVGSERDVAFLTLQVPLGDRTSWMGLDPTFKQGHANLSGYPFQPDSRLANDTAWAYDDAVDAFTHLRHFEVHPGHSGGPVWHYGSDGRPSVVGIVSSGFGGNGGAAFDIATSYQSILGWIASNDHLIA